MYISTKDWNNFIGALSKLNQASADAIVKYVNKYGFGDTDALVGYAKGVVDLYGNASASLAAQMYDEIAELEGKFYEPAELADTPDYGEVAKTVYGVLKTSDNPKEMGGAVSRLVKRTGQDTLLQNGIRDGAEFAWIPNGDTCAFCLTLASRGWQKISKKALKNGHAEHIHSNCDCSYMIRHSDDVDVAGYEPEKYLAMYEGAEGDTPNEKINYMRRFFSTKKKELKTQADNNIQTHNNILNIKKSNTNAKSIEEAEKIIKQYIDVNQFAATGVSYKGISVESANIINNALITWYNNFDVNKLGGVVAPATNSLEGKVVSGAQAAYHPIRNSLYINRKSCKTPEILVEELRNERSLEKKFLNNRDQFDTTKMSNRVLNCLENSIESGRGKVAENMEEVINHELGHALQRYVYNHPQWNTASENIGKYSRRISGYACDGEDEYLAESFCSFMKGESVIDPVLRSIFTDLMRK